MAQKIVLVLVIATLWNNIHCSGVLPSLPGIAYTRAIPYNVPPFAAAVSYLRTGPAPILAPAPALLPPHLHARYSPVIAPHFHAAPAPYYPAVAPPHLAVAPHHLAYGAYGGLAGVPAILPHAASPLPHVGVLAGPHAHLAPAVLPAPVGVPHVHPYAAHPAPHIHTYAVPGAPHVHALPHVHGPAAFAPLVSRGHVHPGHVDSLQSLHHHRR